MTELTFALLLKKNEELENRVRELENLVCSQKGDAALIPAELICHTLFQLAPFTEISITSYDDGTIYDVSDSYCEDIGFSREQLIGKTTLELGIWVNAEDREMVKRLLAQDGGYRNIEIQYRKKDGTLFTDVQSAKLVTFGDRKFIIGTHLSVTELRRAEKESREAKERFEMLFNLSPLPSLLSRLSDGLITDVNEGFLAHSGFRRDEVIGKTSIALGIYGNPADREALIKNLMGKRSFEGIEIKIRLKNGNTATCLVFAKVLTLLDVQYLLLITNDISEKKQAEEEIRQYAKELEDANTALRVVMRQQSDEQKSLEEKIQQNINELVLPYLSKLRQFNFNNKHEHYLNVLESNLSDVLSPFFPNLTVTYRNITPQEIQIVDLIRKGKNTKEIAEILHLSINTVATHRSNIRKKLALKNNRINLRSYLLSLPAKKRDDLMTSKMGANGFV